MIRVREGDVTMKSGSVSQRKFKDVMMMAMKKEEESTG
jgi:hypothetical protein